MSLFTCTYSYLLVPHCKVRVRGGRESMQEAGKRERERDKQLCWTYEGRMILYLSPDLKDGQCCYSTRAVFKIASFHFLLLINCSPILLPSE